MTNTVTGAKVSTTGVAQKYKDLAARAGWTALAAVLGVVGTPAVVAAINGDIKASLPAAYSVLIPSIAVLVSAAKSFLGTKVGDPNTVTWNAPRDKAAREAKKQDDAVAVIQEHGGVVVPPPPSGVPVPLPPPFQPTPVAPVVVAPVTGGFVGPDNSVIVPSTAPVSQPPPSIPDDDTPLFERSPAATAEEALPQGEPDISFAANPDAVELVLGGWDDQ